MLRDHFSPARHDKEISKPAHSQRGFGAPSYLPGWRNVLLNARFARERWQLQKSQAGILLQCQLDGARLDRSDCAASDPTRSDDGLVCRDSRLLSRTFTASCIPWLKLLSRRPQSNRPIIIYASWYTSTRSLFALQTIYRVARSRLSKFGPNTRSAPRSCCDTHSRRKQHFLAHTQSITPIEK